MAADAGREEGYEIPIRLQSHTECLEKLFLPGSRATPFTNQGQACGQQGQDVNPLPGQQPRLFPPTVQTLRSQLTQLQQQRRAKQRQQITLDANPVRFDVPRVVQEQLQGSSADAHRTLQLVGGSALPANVASTLCRRDRGGGVLVPLRMLASLVITDGAAGAPLDAGEAGQAAEAAAAAAQPRQQQEQQEREAGVLEQDEQRHPQAQRPRAQSLPSIGRTRSGDSVSVPHQQPPVGEGPHQQQQQQIPPQNHPPEPQAVAAGSLQQGAAPGAAPADQIEHQMDATAAGLEGQAPEDGAVRQPIGANNTAGSQQPQGGHAPPQALAPSLHRMSNPSPAGSRSPLASAPLSAEHTFLDSSQRYEREEQPPELYQPEQQQSPLVEDFGENAGTAATAGNTVPDDDEGDGAMLIDMGSSDRTPEGALLPTPERPRGAVAASGWDELRGLGMPADNELAGGGSAGGGVAGALALLSPPPLDTAAITDTDISPDMAAPGQLPSPQQPQELLDDVMGEAEQPGAGGAAAEVGAGAAVESNRLESRQAAAGLGEGAGVDVAADEGFDADDEGEAARREERARAPTRAGARGRHLPGLSSELPWHGTPLAAHAMSDLIPGAAVATSGPSLTLHPLPTSAPRPHGPHGPELDPVLVELLKLKCALRRAVQGQDTHAMGLILSLLAALPASPQLLAHSQIVALVAPLKQHANEQVAAAARHLLSFWKTSLKLAAKRAAYSAAPSQGIPQGGAGRSAAAGAAAAATSRDAAGVPQPQPQPRSGLAQGRHAPGWLAVSRSGQDVASLGREEAQDSDVAMRDQADQQQQEKEHQQCAGLDERCLALGQADDMAEDLLIETGGSQPACQLVSPRLPPMALQPSPGGQLPLVGLGTSGTGLGGDSGSTRVCSGCSPSDSRTVTDVEVDVRSSDEEAADEGLAAAESALAAGGIITDAGLLCERGHGRSTPGAATSCLPLRNPSVAVTGPATANFPLLSHVQPNLHGADTGGFCMVPVTALAPAVSLPQPVPRAPLPATPRELTAARTAAAVTAGAPACPPGRPAPSSIQGTGGGGGAGGRNVCSGGVLPTPSWKTSACTLPRHPHPEAGAGLQAAAAPLGSAAVTTAPLVLAQPTRQPPAGRKRKLERQVSRRRCGSTGRRACPVLSTGQTPDTPGALCCGEQASTPVHGSAAAHRAPGRASLVGLHAPLNKRQRYLSGGPAGAHGTAAQLRKVSHLLGSLDLGSGCEAGNEAWDEEALEAMEGDVEADADLGSQDEAAMLTSEDDTQPLSADAGASVPAANAGGGGNRFGIREGAGPAVLPLTSPGGGALHGSLGSNMDNQDQARGPAAEELLFTASPRAGAQDWGLVSGHGGGVTDRGPELAAALEGQQPGPSSPRQSTALRRAYLALHGDDGNGTNIGAEAEAAAGQAVAQMVPSVAN
ncbi:hypothetical protein Agub_g549 [Astrephomene gubernaculifera]|uniref:TFIIS N-terminal domain-containing protein n=1 Tax=Astrephomene gubernaculifera TaxID=47775 RepID=A0AAD3DEX6_9CHLO|nr:hypothetical protein Agub_g549 [Astrephomene gubernaculifera]